MSDEEKLAYLELRSRLQHEACARSLARLPNGNEMRFRAAVRRSSGADVARCSDGVLPLRFQQAQWLQRELTAETVAGLTREMLGKLLPGGSAVVDASAGARSSGCGRRPSGGSASSPAGAAGGGRGGWGSASAVGDGRGPSPAAAGAAGAGVRRGRIRSSSGRRSGGGSVSSSGGAHPSAFCASGYQPPWSASAEVVEFMRRTGPPPPVGDPFGERADERVEDDARDGPEEHAALWGPSGATPPAEGEH